MWGRFVEGRVDDTGAWSDHPVRPASRFPVRPALGGLATMLEAERGRWFLWVPVCFGLGVGVYFALPFEPGHVLAVALLVGAAGLKLTVRRGTVWMALTGLLLAMAAGFATAKVRTEFVRGPVIQKKTGFLVLTGWIERIEARGEKGRRITLRLASLQGFEPKRMPFRVRIQSRFAGQPLEIGAPLSVRARLLPPPAPVMPGGYDFARAAWFARLGGVGFAVEKPTVLAGGPGPPPILSAMARLERLRRTIGARIRGALPGPSGAVAKALITGDRGDIPESTLEALRRSGLAHILAISGLHMAMMAGAIFWLARAGMALVPGIVLRYRTKVWAAFLGLAGGAVYLMISGASIATERAYVMVALMFLAIILARPAVTLRNLALAALVILVWRPESILNISFQMSFAAVTGLVSVFEVMARRTRREPTESPGRLTVPRRVLGFFLGVMLTTVVASLAVAPFSAYHFHKIAQYGLLANLLVVPMFSLLVMPMALVTLLALPFSLEAWPLAVMGHGIDMATGVAGRVASWQGAVAPVAQMPALSLWLAVAGGLWLALWQRRWRYAGLALVGAGLALSTSVKRPDILISRDGRTVAIRLTDGLLSARSGRGRSFDIRMWGEADGDPREVREIGRGKGYRCDPRGCVARVAGQRLALPNGAIALADDCRDGDIVVMAFSQARPCPSARLVIDAADLRRGGAHALTIRGGTVTTETVAQWRGHRPWVASGERPTGKSAKAATAGPGAPVTPSRTTGMARRSGAGRPEKTAGARVSSPVRLRSIASKPSRQ